MEMLHIKLWRIIKELSISRAFIIICTVVYCDLYYDNWRCHLKNKKNGEFNLFTCIIFSACQFLCYFFKNYTGCHVILKISYVYIYLKLELGTEKHIFLKWEFLPQWLWKPHCTPKYANRFQSYFSVGDSRIPVLFFTWHVFFLVSCYYKGFKKYESY